MLSDQSCRGATPDSLDTDHYRDDGTSLSSPVGDQVYVHYFPGKNTTKLKPAFKVYDDSYLKSDKPDIEPADTSFPSAQSHSARVTVYE